MNSKTTIALSVIGVAAVLLLVTAPILANQTFGYKYYHGKYHYHKYYKRCY